VSPALQALLWSVREPWAAHCGAGAVPLLLRAAPADARAALHETAAALLAAAASAPCQPPAHSHLAAAVNLQALCAGCVPAGARGAAAEGFFLAPAASRGPLLPLLALHVAAGEPHIDSTAARALFAAAAEAPLTMGRATFWALRCAARAAPLRARAGRLLRALLDGVLRPALPAL
jgi:hypothetical protein